MLKRFGLFWLDIVVGDDWRVAAWVAAALILTGVLAAIGLPAWWVLPVSAAAVLTGSIAQAARANRDHENS